MKIGAVADILGRRVQTIRLWEKLEWIDLPRRDDRGWREYTAEDVVKLIKKISSRNVILPYAAEEFVEKHGG